MASEGGYDQLTDPSFARAFAKGGGRRVLLGCSTHGGCPDRYRDASRLLAGAGVEARVNDAGNLGHTLDGRVIASLKKDWPWLVDGAPGWHGYPLVQANNDKYFSSHTRLLLPNFSMATQSLAPLTTAHNAMKMMSSSW
jgi:hypothetical protein